jgi:predicted transcriptional regulator
VQLGPCGIEVVSFGVAMTLRLDTDEADALRAQAASERRSMQDVAREAIREYVARRAHEVRRDDAARRVIETHADALDKLGRV